VPTQGLPEQDGQCNTRIETQALLTLPIVRAFTAHATVGHVPTVSKTSVLVRNDLNSLCRDESSFGI
jgi:hypothetical protein